MCGFIAWIGAPDSVDTGALERGLHAIAHRGPDGRGLYVSRNRAVALGHVRLALVAEADGKQPLHTQDDQLHAVVNGEIYDDDHMRRELIARGHIFSTQSDSEVLLHLYAEHGKDAVKQLRGELAFALHDEREHVLVAGRDRFGIKPLVYSVTPRGVWIASEAKALFAAGIQAEWDPRSFAHAATHQYLPQTRTMFRGIAALPPGHLLVVDEKTLRVSFSNYWDMMHFEPSGSSEESRADALREAIDEAVRLRLRADRPPAFHLSGGIDSTSIVALAKRHMHTRPTAFTVQFDSDDYAEAHFADESARALGVDLHIVEADPTRLFDALSDAVFAGETLGINAQLPAKLLLSRAIRAAGFRSVLSGEGADEALLGYAHLALDHQVEHGETNTRTRSVQDAVMLPTTSVDAPALRESFGFVPSFLASKLAIGARFQALLHHDVAIAEHLAILADSHDAQGARCGPHARRSAYLWSKLALAGYILRALGDGVEMAASIEGRPPFLDHVFFEQAQRLPPAQLFRDGTTKWLFREAMRGVVPEAVRMRAKHPFLAPPFAAFRTPGMRDAVRDVLSPSRVQCVPFFDAHKVTAFLDGLDRLDASKPEDAQTQQAHEPVLQLALTTVLLGERFALS